jgi:tetratricopeptide (TPR) repeat protein
MLAGKTKRWLGNPFRGLEVFEFEHAPIFRGRTKAVGEHLDLLIRLGNIRKPFVLVIGASGSGKSSFVRAGVLPLLTEPGIVEGIGLWRRAVARPAAAGAGGDPFDALAAALLNPAALPDLADQESTSPVTGLADELRENPAGVALRVKDALRAAALRWKDRQEQFLRTREEEMKAGNRLKDAVSARQQREQLSEPRARLALVVDQLEELFTTGFSPEIQEKYVSAVSGLARSGRVFIIATLRSDFYARYQEFPELVELAKEGRFDLRPPGAGEIPAIIQQPAEAAGLSFERDPESGESLDEALRDAAIKNPESLPLLQHALDQLFHAQAGRQDNLLRWSDYRALGGVEGALAKHAEATFEKLHPHEQGAFPVVMGQLVTLGQGEEEVPNRRSALYSDFSAAEAEGQSRTGAQGFIDLFVKNRLLMADTDASGNVVISVAHEALLRHWTRVREWLAVNREFLRMRDRLDANLQIWKGRGRQKADLLQRGLPLAEGEKLLSDFAASLGPEQSDYIGASIAESHRQRHRRNLVRNGVLAVFALLAVGAGIQWFRAENEAKLAQKQTKAADDARDQADGLINFMLHDLRDKLQPIGRLDALDDVAKKAKEYLDGLPKELITTSRLKQQADLLRNLGEVLVAQGKLAEALDAYQRDLAIAKRLAEQDKTNAGWQQDLAFIYDKFGEVLMFQGKLAEALDSCQQGLAITKRLAEQDKTNSGWQQDLAFNYERVGEVLEAQNKFAETLDLYQQSLAIRKRLAEQDKSNSGWQRAVALSYDRLGDVLEEQGKLAEALDCYQQSVAIFKPLAEHDKTNSQLQRNLLVSYEKVGEVLEEQGKLAEALDGYRQTLTIAKRLSEQDKSNTDWQRDLAVTYDRIGEVLVAQGKLPEALEAFRNAFPIADMLASRDPSNVIWLNSAAWIRYCIANVLIRIKDGDRNEARRLVAEGIEIITRLEHQGALSRDAQEASDKLKDIANVLNSSSRE